MEIIDSIKGWVKEKNSSPLYFTYISFVIVWNWRFFYILFFEDTSIIGFPKNEYLSLYLETNKFSSWFSIGLGPIVGFVSDLLYHFVPPIIFTYIAIVFFPKIHAKAHEIYLNNHFSRKLAYDDARLRYERQRTMVLNEEAKEKVEQMVKNRKIAENTTPEDLFNLEFDDFSKDKSNIEAMMLVDKVVYEFKGRFTTDPEEEDHWRPFIKADFLSILDSFDLVSIGDGSVSLTDKGKAYVRRIRRDSLG